MFYIEMDRNAYHNEATIIIANDGIIVADYSVDSLLPVIAGRYASAPVGPSFSDMGAPGIALEVNSDDSDGIIANS